MEANGRFGRSISDARKRLGLTQKSLAREIGISAGHMSNLETGRRSPSFTEVPALDTVLHTKGRLMRLWEELTDSGDADFLDKLALLERSATSILAYEVNLVPALLQTEEYARTIIRAGAPWLSVADVATKVQDRIKRGEWFGASETPLMHVVLDHGVISRVVGSGAIMDAQLQNLVELADSERIVLQVIPPDELRHPGLTGSLWVLSSADTLDVAYAESVHTGQNVDDPAHVARYRFLFGRLQAVALRPGESVQLVRDQIERVKSNGT
ncbi:transcriptional regulator with XRE-family HTH domain [Murinocardiopsis flavida]|uniref:Transcriptional regulator with XRE-family HTH domain n=1 Tax=Murinocardiopsis flavida TaxID=645275 RepID=A0A2P8D964_9ACTN|nr:helix-turn-helix transcriptional regulator [Murinocardiopsis flavida]PSK93743.1 transcriptional regulator with XRE-family HTH domain [Murinocardiopsis flavida]